MTNVKVYGWRSPNRSGALQLVVNYTTKEAFRGYYLSHHTDELLPTRKALDLIQEVLENSGFKIELNA